MKISDVNKFKGGKNNVIKSVRSKNWQIEVGANIIFEVVGRDTSFGPLYRPLFMKLKDLFNFFLLRDWQLKNQRAVLVLCHK